MIRARILAAVLPLVAPSAWPAVQVALTQRHPGAGTSVTRCEIESAQAPLINGRRITINCVADQIFSGGFER